MKEEATKRLKEEGRIKAAGAAMFDVRGLRFDVKARKAGGLRNAECGVREPNASDCAGKGGTEGRRKKEESKKSRN